MCTGMWSRRCWREGGEGFWFKVSGSPVRCVTRKGGGTLNQKLETRNLPLMLRSILCAVCLVPIFNASAQTLPPEIPRRLIAIDNVCAWPNLVQLKDGSLVAIVFNQPNHGRTEGDVHCWGSADGLSWRKFSTVTQHEPQT